MALYSFLLRYWEILRQLWARVRRAARWRRQPADAAFAYSPFRDPKTEIRLLSLLPGKADDPVRVVVWHAELLHPGPAPVDSERATMAEVRAALPPGWVAIENYTGQYIFEHEESAKTTWSHPNPDFDQSRLKPLPQLSPPGFSPSYEALSYVWGSPDNPLSIEAALSPSADDRVSRRAWRHLSVGQNLFEALVHLRRPREPRVLWIDAICVNQADDAEKPDQIMRMADIYSLASRVLSWLGPASTGAASSSLAIATLTYIGQQVETGSNGGTYEAPGATESMWFQPHTVFPYDASVWAAVQALLSRPYFDRVWILQEVAGGNDQAVAICGDASISWPLLKDAIVILVNNNTIAPAIRAITEGLMHLTMPASVIPVPDLFAMSMMRTCTDPRDKIYGILGMAPHAFALAMRPHYTRSLAFIYANAVMTYATMEHSLVLVHMCQISQRSLAVRHLPSWIPDFSAPEQTSPIGSYTHASGYTRAHFSFGGSGTTLTFAGRRLAVVQSVHAACTSTVDSRDAIATVRAWMPPDILTAPYIGGGQLLDAFLFMLRFSYVDDRWPMLRETTLAQWRTYFLAHIYGAAVPDDADMSLVYTTAAFIRNRVFITTDDGHIGLAPRGTEPGDIVTAVLGCTVCILLRPVQNAGAWQIAGQAYVQGFDDGSGLLGSLPPDWTLQVRFRDSGSTLRRSYVNARTGEDTLDHPRLRPLPAAWTVADPADDDVDPDARIYSNQDTGETCTGDPRLKPEALRQRGINVEDFLIV